MEEIDREDGHDGFEGAAEARLHGDEVVGEGKQREGPGKQNSARNVSPEGQDEAENAGKRDEAVVEDAEKFIENTVFDRLGNAYPVEVETLDG